MRKTSVLTVGAVLACASLVCCAQVGGESKSSFQSDDGVALGRYTSMDARPALSVRNPMRVVATVNFPKSHVQTVGDAVKHLLVRTGYELSAPAQLGDAQQALLGLALPESHRRIGPYRVEAILQALLGDSWAVQIDHGKRRVSFYSLDASTSSPVAAQAQH
jgi:conjugative transfer region protein (TIGR03748 family)